MQTGTTKLIGTGMTATLKYISITISELLWLGQHLLSHVDCSNCEFDSFQPQHHEETLTEGTVAHILSIMACLETHRANLRLML